MNNFQGGWVDSPPEVHGVMSQLPMPVFADVHGAIKGSGAGKTVLLYNYVKKVLGYFPCRYQKGPDCVAESSAGAVTALMAVEIALGDNESFLSEICSEDIYGGSRVNIGGGRLGNGGGSVGAWAAQYINTYGTLRRQKYANHDLSTYDYSKSEQWGRPGNGVPQYLLEIARDHKVGTVSQVRTYEEVRDAIANGYPVTIASNQGFGTTRDKEGFLSPSGSWPHQMYIVAVDDAYRRPGVLIMNSWGSNWVSGPKRLEQPDGSFWCDADVLEKRILSANDSWAYSNYVGFPPQDLDLRIL